MCSVNSNIPSHTNGVGFKWRLILFGLDEPYLCTCYKNVHRYYTRPVGNATRIREQPVRG